MWNVPHPADGMSYGERAALFLAVLIFGALLALGIFS
jgi:hypothetical protein